jgi:hypothetical protein
LISATVRGRPLLPSSLALQRGNDPNIGIASGKFQCFGLILSPRRLLSLYHDGFWTGEDDHVRIGRGYRAIDVKNLFQSAFFPSVPRCV